MINIKQFLYQLPRNQGDIFVNQTLATATIITRLFAVRGVKFFPKMD